MSSAQFHQPTKRTLALQVPEIHDDPHDGRTAMGPPSASELLSDSTVIDAMRRAFEESDVGGRNPVEQGGFILKDPLTGTFSVALLPAGAADSLVYPVCSDGMHDGKQIVGSFHTHPNTGPDWQQEPSLQDIRLSQEYPETMGAHQFVISQKTIYHIDDDGAVGVAGRTVDLLKLGEDHSR
jgi:hypothetical protein